MKTKIIISCVTVLMVAGAATKLKSNKIAVEEKVYREDASKKVLVQTTTVSKQQLDKTFTYTGTFAPNREVMLVPQAHGQVEAIYFKEGDAIKEGQLLVQIDDDLLQAQHISAQAGYETARRNFERYGKASESNGVSKMQYDDYQLKFRNADAQLKQIVKQIALSKITAPFGGTITLRDVELGSVVGSNAIGRLTDLSQLKLEISVPEGEIAQFRPGDVANVASPLYPGKVLEGKIDYVADRADNSHNYAVKIVVRNNASTGIKAGMYGTASLSKGLSHETLIVPRAALLGSAKHPQVFVVENEVAKLVSIQTGKSTGEYVEVVDGIKTGDVVVTSGHINLTEGSRVAMASLGTAALSPGIAKK